MTRWNVALEGRATGEPTVIENPVEVRSAVIAALGEHAGSVGVGTRSWSAAIEVELDDGIGDARHVTEIGWGRITAALSAAGVPQWPVVRVAATRAEVAGEAPIPVLPEIVGISEVLKLTNVSRQQLWQMRATGRFPHPLVELKDSPIWSRSEVDAFVADRRPANRAATPMPASTTVRLIGSEGVLVPKKDGPQIPPGSGGTNLRANFNLRPVGKP